jgi:hypothetical protein
VVAGTEHVRQRQQVELQLHRHARLQRLVVTGSDPRDRRPVQQGAQLTVHADVQHPSALQLPFATAPPGGPRVSP